MMDKKILGIRIGTYLTVLLAFVFAVILWLYVKIVPNTIVNSAISSVSAWLR